MIKNLNKFRTFILGASLFVMVALVGSLLYLNIGGNHIGLSLSGSLKATDLNDIAYPGDGPGFLACDTSICPKAKADAPLIELKKSPKEIRNAITYMVDSDPRLSFRHLDLLNLSFDITAKTRSKAFPDLVTVKIIAGPSQEQSFLAFYSRAIIGGPTPELDVKRAQKWLRLIKNH